MLIYMQFPSLLILKVLFHPYNNINVIFSFILQEEKLYNSTYVS